MGYFFFTLRNFEIDVGESVRIYGIVNSLASNGHEVTLISNAKRFQMFHPSIKHISIGYEFESKRSFQGYLALFHYSVVYFKYKALFKKIGKSLKYLSNEMEAIYFFDYLDNSIGYVLKKKKLISKYINDIHGIATIEFKNHIKNSRSLKSRIVGWIKYKLVYWLDKKVFEFADGFIYGSEKMKKYYDSMYNLGDKKSVIMPYLLGSNAVNRKVDLDLKMKLQDGLKLLPDDFVILFVGTYKPTAGVEDLIMAFEMMFDYFKMSKLILIGGGPNKNHCLKLASLSVARDNIHFIDNVPYSELLTYQNIADVVVCPDRENPYSNYVIHVKYFDALISGKLVINGAFESVKEINVSDSLSLTFEPSNIKDLFNKLKLCKDDFVHLSEKYRETKKYASENLTYASYLSTHSL